MGLWIPEKIRISVDVNIHFDKLVIESKNGDMTGQEEQDVQDELDRVKNKPA